MRKLVLVLAVIFGMTPVFAQQRDTLRILAIGNSFSVDGVEHYLWELFDAAGIPVVIGNMYIGGCTLEKHWNNALSDAPAYSYRKIRGGVRSVTKDFSLERAFADEDWDIVTFQQQSGRSGKYETYQPWLHLLVGYALERTRPDTKFLWYQTWAYAQDSGHKEFPNYGCSQKKMYKAILAASRRAVRAEKFKGVIPAGTAIQNGRRSSLGDSFNRDGFHLEKTFGRYTAACTWFEAISGVSVDGNPYYPDSISAEVASICQKAAHSACLHPWRSK